VTNDHWRGGRDTVECVTCGTTMLKAELLKPGDRPICSNCIAKPAIEEFVKARQACDSCHQIISEEGHRPGCSEATREVSIAQTIIFSQGDIKIAILSSGKYRVHVPDDYGTHGLTLNQVGDLMVGLAEVYRNATAR
jgi:hypothetical protein